MLCRLAVSLSRCALCISLQLQKKPPRALPTSLTALRRTQRAKSSTSLSGTNMIFVAGYGCGEAQPRVRRKLASLIIHCDCITAHVGE